MVFFLDQRVAYSIYATSLRHLDINMFALHVILFPRYKSVKTAQSFKSLQSTLLTLSTFCAAANEFTMLQVSCGKKPHLSPERSKYVCLCSLLRLTTCEESTTR